VTVPEGWSEVDEALEREFHFDRSRRRSSSSTVWLSLQRRPRDADRT